MLAWHATCLGSILSSLKAIRKQCLASGAIHWEEGCGYWKGAGWESRAPGSALIVLPISLCLRVRPLPYLSLSVLIWKMRITILCGWSWCQIWALIKLSSLIQMAYPIPGL